MTEELVAIPKSEYEHLKRCKETLLQMFEDGNSDSIAMAVAKKIKQRTIDKACEFIRLHIGVDIPVRLTPDGEPLAEDFINKAEERVNAANKVVEKFKQFMEE